MLSRNVFVCCQEAGFNFPQKAWLVDTAMGWRTLGQRINLALNILEQVIPDPAVVPMKRGYASMRALYLAASFADEALNLPPEGGLIPTDFVVDWIENQPYPLNHAPRQQFHYEAA